MRNIPHLLILPLLFLLRFIASGQAHMIEINLLETTENPAFQISCEDQKVLAGSSHYIWDRIGENAKRVNFEIFFADDTVISLEMEENDLLRQSAITNLLVGRSKIFGKLPQARTFSVNIKGKPGRKGQMIVMKKEMLLSFDFNGNRYLIRTMPPSFTTKGYQTYLLKIDKSESPHTLQTGCAHSGESGSELLEQPSAAKSSSAQEGTEWNSCPATRLLAVAVDYDIYFREGGVEGWDELAITATINWLASVFFEVKEIYANDLNVHLAISQLYIATTPGENPVNYTEESITGLGCNEDVDINGIVYAPTLISDFINASPSLFGSPYDVPIYIFGKPLYLNSTETCQEIVGEDTITWEIPAVRLITGLASGGGNVFYSQPQYSEDIFGDPITLDIFAFAHELGHNLGASHSNGGIMKEFPEDVGLPLQFFSQTMAEVDAFFFAGAPTDCYCHARLHGKEYLMTSFISKVALANLENQSGSDTGYGNYLDQVAELGVGQNYEITLERAGENINQNWHVWIDFDQDKLFEQDELIVQQIDQSGVSIYQTFDVPENAPVGITRMRVIMMNAGGGDPCERYTTGGGFNGEVEDYQVKIGDPYSDYCAIWATKYSRYINELSINDFTNQSGIDGGYGDFTGLGPVSLEAGLPFSFQAEVLPFIEPPLNTLFANDWAVWIDLNQNGYFENFEQVLSLDNLTGNLVDQQILLPANALPGETRMRVVVGAYDTSLTPCGGIGHIEAEDYLIDVFSVYCPIQASQNASGHIDVIVIDDLINPSGPDPNGYGDYTVMSVPLETGQTYEIQTMMDLTAGLHAVSAWIDFDLDLQFEEDERIVNEEQLSVNNFDFNFDVPATAALGATRFRIRMVPTFNNPSLPLDPCLEYQFGETEDYTIEIVPFVGFAPPGNSGAKINDSIAGTKSLFPNPAGNILHIQGLDIQNPVHWKIWDARGILQSLPQIEGNTLDISGLPKGLYFFSCQGEDGTTETLSFIKI